MTYLDTSALAKLVVRETETVARDTPSLWAAYLHAGA